MIATFPTPYEDELLYSLFARYPVRSGYTSYVFAARDLFKKDTAKPSLEFLIELPDEALDVLTREKTLEEIVMQYTMFPEYARFLPAERRKRALELLLQMDKEFNNLIHWKKGKGTQRRWLRYCPECARESREQHGEAYWRREHQLIGVDVCIKHECRIMNSSIEMCSCPSPSLLCAECEIPLNEQADYNVKEIEMKVARYITEVFRSELDMQNTISVGEFLHSKMEYTKYLSERGTHRRVNVIYEDFVECYKELSNNPIKEAWQIGKVFTKGNMNHYDMCLLAMFLGVKPDELVHMKLPAVSQSEIYDDRVRELHKQGLNYRQVADVMGTSYDMVKSVASDMQEALDEMDRYMLRTKKC